MPPEQKVVSSNLTGRTKSFKHFQPRRCFIAYPKPTQMKIRERKRLSAEAAVLEELISGSLLPNSGPRQARRLVEVGRASPVDCALRQEVGTEFAVHVLHRHAYLFGDFFDIPSGHL